MRLVKGGFGAAVTRGDETMPLPNDETLIALANDLIPPVRQDLRRAAARSREAVEVMRRLWEDSVSSYSGEFFSFSDARAFPKPTRRIPMIVGGQTEAALRRAANYGDGWCGFNLTPAETAEKVKLLDRLLAEKGRRREDFEIFVSPVVTEPPGLDRRVSRCRRRRALPGAGFRHAVRDGGGDDEGDRGSR